MDRRREVTVRETVLRLRTCPELGKDSARRATTTTDAPTEPTATHGAAAAKWDPRRVGYYRARFQDETACLRAAAQ